MKEMVKDVELSKLHPHPKNPRFAPREDVVDQIATQIIAAGAFDQAHALIVRPNAKGYEIISGHHRALAAKKAKLKAVPCWVRKMTDEEAYMALVLHNAQSELEPLEEGMHALDSGMDQKAYAAKVGKARATLQDRWHAAEVFRTVRDIPHGSISLLPYWSSLSESGEPAKAKRSAAALIRMLPCFRVQETNPTSIAPSHCRRATWAAPRFCARG